MTYAFYDHRTHTALCVTLTANLLYCSAIVVEGVLLVPFLRPHAAIIRRIALVLGILLACGIAGGMLVDVLFSEFDSD